MESGFVPERGGAGEFGAHAIDMVESGSAPGWVPLPNPLGPDAVNPPFSARLTDGERANLDMFDTMDFQVFSKADWARLAESHAPHVRCYWPDGHFTDGIDQHIADLKALFAWSPDCHIAVHPIRVAKDNLTAVTGVLKGTFSQPMADGSGGVIAPTGNAYAINMCTVGIWNPQGRMDEEFLFWDSKALYDQLGLA